LKKTPPEETRIVTRQTDDGSEPARPDDAREILEMVDTALDEQAAWLREWHRAVVCRTPPIPPISADLRHAAGRFAAWFDINRKRGLLDQPVFQQLWATYGEMRALGAGLAKAATDGKHLPAADYDAFMDKAESFAAIARRIRDAFQRAVYDLDPLTGVRSRRSMMTELARERERSIRTGNAVHVGLCDIDNFKAVNDAHGHLAGDAVLVAVAGRLISNLRPYDSVYRYGGDEFLLAFTEIDGEQAIGIAERLQAAIGTITVRMDDRTALSVTASFGLSALDREAAIETTIRRADEALYRAKGEGRNRVILWQAACAAGGGSDG
jgi:diguanylate cyclase (GGDEF)-like protein